MNNAITLNSTDALSYCNSILPHVSRSFALGINTLKGHMRKNILIGYLLCRIADTIEDDVLLPSEKKCAYLEEFIRCFDDKNKSSFISKIGEELHGDPFHIHLVKNTHTVFYLFDSLSQKSKIILTKWVKEMSLGMIHFIKKYPSGIRIKTLKEYKEYCYYVAGTVGHMLTDLWKEYGLFISQKRYENLNKMAGIFGQALQTINILKDIAWDIKNENAIFIPQQNFSESSIHEIVTLAENDLKTSLDYIQGIPCINRSIRFFCIFPLLLAMATLREIKKSSSILSPTEKIKVTRTETKQIYKNSYLASVSNLWLRRVAKRVMN